MFVTRVLGPANIENIKHRYFFYTAIYASLVNIHAKSITLYYIGGDNRFLQIYYTICCRWKWTRSWSRCRRSPQRRVDNVSCRRLRGLQTWWCRSSLRHSRLGGRRPPHRFGGHLHRRRRIGGGGVDERIVRRTNRREKNDTKNDLALTLQATRLPVTHYIITYNIVITLLVFSVPIYINTYTLYTLYRYYIIYYIMWLRSVYIQIL